MINSIASQSRNQNGYTLLELLVVLSILMMAYALFTPAFLRGNSSADFKAISQEIVGDMKKLRSRAILKGEILEFEILNDGLSYRFTGSSSDVILSDGTSIEVTINNDNPKQIKFFPNGTTNDFMLRIKKDNREMTITSEWPLGTIKVLNDA